MSFEITGLDSLAWTFKKLREIKKSEDEIKEYAAIEKERIEQWEQEELKKFESDKTHFTNLIHQYHMRELENNPASKTLSTPYGKSKSRYSAESVEKADEKTLLSYAIARNEFIEPKLKWAELKKSLQIVEKGEQKVIVDDNGEIVPGVNVKPASVNYSLEVL